MINVIGLGYIGLPTALMLAAHGVEVVGTDYNAELVATLNAGKTTFKEKNINILFEIHTGEETKSGFECFEDVEMALNLFSENKFPHITPIGFMTMAPFTDDKSLIHKSFETVYNLSQKLQQQFPSFDLSELSMGMSCDYPIAVAMGSTIVRIGSMIFGERN